MNAQNQIVMGQGNNFLVNHQVLLTNGQPYNVANCSGSLYVGNATSLVNHPMIVITGSVLSGSTGWMQFPFLPANTNGITPFFGDSFPAFSYEIRITDYSLNPPQTYTTVRGQFIIQM